MRAPMKDHLCFIYVIPLLWHQVLPISLLLHSFLFKDNQLHEVKLDGSLKCNWRI